MVLKFSKFLENIIKLEREKGNGAIFYFIYLYLNEIKFLNFNLKNLVLYICDFIEHMEIIHLLFSGNI